MLIFEASRGACSWLLACSSSLALSAPSSCLMAPPASQEPPLSWLAATAFAALGRWLQLAHSTGEAAAATAHPGCLHRGCSGLLACLGLLVSAAGSQWLAACCLAVPAASPLAGLAPGCSSAGWLAGWGRPPSGTKASPSTLPLQS